MGWSSGGELMQNIVRRMRGICSDETRKSVYKVLIKSFEDNDWDNQEEMLGEDNIKE